MEERLADDIPSGDELAIVTAGSDEPIEDDVEGEQGKGNKGRSVEGYLFGGKREAESIVTFEQTKADGKENGKTDMG